MERNDPSVWAVKKRHSLATLEQKQGRLVGDSMPNVTPFPRIVLRLSEMSGQVDVSRHGSGVEVRDGRIRDCAATTGWGARRGLPNSSCSRNLLAWELSQLLNPIG
jgi:hypothetical protein